MKRICVFCGSSPGKQPEYLEAAVSLGHTLVQRGLELTYGGGSVGLMGMVARTVMESGGSVHGVIPRHLLEREVGSTDLTELHVVDTMHERKAQLFELSDGFISLPGGFGTLEECFEMLTWAQLGLHAKPCGLLNIAGYYDHLLAFLDHTTAQEFIAREHRDMLLVADDPALLLDRFVAYQPPQVDKAQRARNQQAHL